MAKKGKCFCYGEKPFKTLASKKYLLGYSQNRTAVTPMLHFIAAEMEMATFKTERR